jgi:hypothetical protein
MSGADINVGKPGDLARMAAAVSLHAPHYLPIMREVCAGRLALVQPAREGIVSVGRLKRMGRPVIFVIGDDDYLSTGPGGWASVDRLMAWAAHIIIHGAAGYVEHYAAIALAAQVTGRLLLIECASAQVQAWRDSAAAKGGDAVIQAVVAAPGVQHPAPLDKMSVQ